jgi:invasion protein IalB
VLLRAGIFLSIFGTIHVFSANAAENLQIMSPSTTSVDAATVTASADKFDDWYVRCLPPGKGLRRCEIVQVAQVMREGKRVNVLTLAVAPIARSAPKDDNKNAQPLALTALVPLNVALQSSLSITAEGKSVAKLAYRNCNQTGCWAELPLRPAMISTLSRGASGEASLRLIDGQDVKIRFSLKGFKAAVAALRSLQSK